MHGCWDIRLHLLHFKFHFDAQNRNLDGGLPGCEQWHLDQTVKAKQCLASSASPPPVSCSSAALFQPPPSSPLSCCCTNPKFISHFYSKEKRKYQVDTSQPLSPLVAQKISILASSTKDIYRTKTTRSRINHQKKYIFFTDFLSNPEKKRKWRWRRNVPFRRVEATAEERDAELHETLGFGGGYTSDSHGGECVGERERETERERCGFGFTFLERSNGRLSWKVDLFGSRSDSPTQGPR